VRAPLAQETGADPAGRPERSGLWSLVVQGADQTTELLRHLDGVDRQCLQVERGCFQNAFLALQLDTMLLLHTRTSPGCLLRTPPAPGSQSLFMVRTRSRPIRWCGREIRPGTFGANLGGDNECRTSDVTESFSIAFPIDALEAHARALGRTHEIEQRGSLWPSVPPPLARRMERRMERLLRVLSTAPGAIESPEVRRVLEGELLDVALAVIGAGVKPERAAPPASRRRALSRALE
jgi:hypothetical protein